MAGQVIRHRVKTPKSRKRFLNHGGLRPDMVATSPLESQKMKISAKPMSLAERAALRWPPWGEPDVDRGVVPA
jgi:hypothetical protein